MKGKITIPVTFDEIPSPGAIKRWLLDRDWVLSGETEAWAFLEKGSGWGKLKKEGTVRLEVPLLHKAPDYSRRVAELLRDLSGIVGLSQEELLDQLLLVERFI